MISQRVGPTDFFLPARHQRALRDRIRTAPSQMIAMPLEKQLPVDPRSKGETEAVLQGGLGSFFASDILLLRRFGVSTQKNDPAEDVVSRKFISEIFRPGIKKPPLTGVLGAHNVKHGGEMSV